MGTAAGRVRLYDSVALALIASGYAATGGMGDGPGPHSAVVPIEGKPHRESKGMGKANTEQTKKKMGMPIGSAGLREKVRRLRQRKDAKESVMVHGIFVCTTRAAPFAEPWL